MDDRTAPKMRKIITTSTKFNHANPTVDAILRWNEGRPPELVRRKFERMSEDMFAFFRGTDHLFAAAWTGLVPVDPGPSILVCGDLHLENFGVYRAEDGDFVFDVNDFDEALVGPCSLDLVRCSTSVLLAAEVWGLSPIQAMRMVLGYLDSYRSTIAEGTSGGPRAGRVSLADETSPVQQLLGDCALGTQVELLDHITRVGKSGHRSIRGSDGKLPPVGKARAAVLAGAVEAYGRSVGRPDAFKVLDVASRIAGIGSLGVKRYVVLVEGDGSSDGNRLLDLKAAGPSSLIGCTEAPQLKSWTDDAVRVVDAQRRLQAKPTSVLDVIEIEDEHFRLREMIPDENRARLDRLRRKPSKLRQAVELAGRISGWSQLRGARMEDGVDRTEPLALWAASPALDAVLASAVRFAAHTRADFKAFRKARLPASIPREN
jgi:uncharacterized protein (DUF2252 family)